MAVNCSVGPLAMLGLAGVTAIDCRVFELDVITAEVVTSLASGSIDPGTAIWTMIE